MTGCHVIVCDDRKQAAGPHVAAAAAASPRVPCPHRVPGPLHRPRHPRRLLGVHAPAPSAGAAKASEEARGARHGR